MTRVSALQRQQELNLAVVRALASENPDAGWLLDPYPSSSVHKPRDGWPHGAAVTDDPERQGCRSGIDPSLVPTRSPISPGASASPASGDPASAVDPGRRSNLQGRAA